MFTQAWFWRGYDETMIHRLIVGLDGWPDEPSRQQAAVAASALLVSSGRIDEAVALVETVGDVTPGPTAVLAAMTLGHGWRAQGRPLAAEASVAAALDFYRSISVGAYLLSSVAMAGLHLQTLADAARFAELDRIVDDNSVGWHDLGDTSNLALANLAHGYSWLVRGDYPRAVALARQQPVSNATGTLECADGRSPFMRWRLRRAQISKRPTWCSGSSMPIEIILPSCLPGRWSGRGHGLPTTAA